MHGTGTFILTTPSPSPIHFSKVRLLVLDTSTDETKYPKNTKKYLDCSPFSPVTIGRTSMYVRGRVTHAHTWTLWGKRRPSNLLSPVPSGMCSLLLSEGCLLVSKRSPPEKSSRSRLCTLLHAHTPPYKD